MKCPLHRRAETASSAQAGEGAQPFLRPAAMTEEWKFGMVEE
jgi:hypothetical protein